MDRQTLRKIFARKDLTGELNLQVTIHTPFIESKKNGITLISGGQSGADQIGLIYAKRQGWNTLARICSKFNPVRGWTWLGPTKTVTDLEGIPGLIHRTKLNIEFAQCTIIISNRRISNTKGTNLTLKMCKKLRKPYYLFFLEEPGGTLHLLKWKTPATELHTINFAGPRQLKCISSVNLDDVFFECGLPITNLPKMNICA